MITIITGTPGSGKTAYIVDYIMDKLREGRKVYTFGIPDLLLGVHDGGDPQKWQTGQVIKINTYAPDLAKELGLQSTWVPRECMTCCYRKTCTGIKTNKTEPPDAGSVLIFDEAHTEFQATSSGSKVPPYIGALTVHRHEGLDMVFISQRPTFMHAFIRGLASEHVHIELNPFSPTGKRKLYKFTEFQENINRTTKLLASKKSYSPKPHVFPLYKSATKHTKLDRNMPNIIWFMGFSILLVIVMAFVFYSRLSDKVEAHQAEEARIAEQKAQLEKAKGQPQPTATPQALTQHQVGTELNPVDPLFLAQQQQQQPQVSSCLANKTKCQCYTIDGVKIYLPDWECRRNAQELTEQFDLDGRQQRNDYPIKTIEPPPPA